MQKAVQQASLAPLSVQRQTFYRLMAYEVVYHHKKNTQKTKSTIFINTTKLKAGSETNFFGLDMQCWGLPSTSLRDTCMTLLWRKKIIKKTRILQSITYNGSHSRNSGFCDNMIIYEGKNFLWLARTMFLGRLKKKKEHKSVFNSFLYISTRLAEPNQQDTGCVYKHYYVHDFHRYFSFFLRIIQPTAETFLIFKDSTGTVGVMDLVSPNAIQNSCTKHTD